MDQIKAHKAAIARPGRARIEGDGLSQHLACDGTLTVDQVGSRRSVAVTSPSSLSLGGHRKLCPYVPLVCDPGVDAEPVPDARLDITAPEQPGMAKPQARSDGALLQRERGADSDRRREGETHAFAFGHSAPAQDRAVRQRPAAVELGDVQGGIEIGKEGVAFKSGAGNGDRGRA